MWVPEMPSTSCNQAVFVDEPAETIGTNRHWIWTTSSRNGLSMGRAVSTSILSARSGSNRDRQLSGPPSLLCPVTSPVMWNRGAWLQWE